MTHRPWLRASTVAGAAFAACHFAPTLATDGGSDVIPDAGMCTSLVPSCAGDSLRVCAQIGGSAMDMPCSWGCNPMGSAHCRQLQPAGGGVSPGDLAGSGLNSGPLTGNLIVNGDTGAIGTSPSPESVRMAGTGVHNGIDYFVHNNVAVFRFNVLQVTGTLALTGSNAIAFVSDGAVTIDNIIDARGFCGLNNPGPGGFAGGVAKMTPAGGGAGTGGGGNNNAGGGGGGYGGSGGAGGQNGGAGPAGGAVFGDEIITVLVGGGGGGGGGGDGNSARVGGGGGGAFQIVSNTGITIHPTGGINAGGCGGKAGNGGQGASGGGAGGTILLEAPAITIGGKLAVNGGAGAGGDGGNDGSDGQLARAASTAGAAASNGTDGGSGAWAMQLFGYAAGNAPSGDHSGGGGGGAGRIRLNTKSGSASVDSAAVLSPALTDTPTTCTQGVAVAN